MAGVSIPQSETIWDASSIEAQVQADLAAFARALKAPVTWPLYPEELAKALWGTETEFVASLPRGPRGEGVVAYFNDAANTIVVNTALNQTDERAAFSIAHEVGHISLHRFIADQRTTGHTWCYEVRGSTGFKAVEWQANRYAAELLLPKSLLVTRVANLVGTNRLDLRIHGDALTSQFSISRQMLEIRLTELCVPFDGAKYNNRPQFARVLDDMDADRRGWNL